MDGIDDIRFPAGFRLGAAASSFQIEGATDADGRGASIWDVFCTRPGAIADGSDGRVACDHYHRLREDVALMGSLGLQAYRFSIAWSRIQPDGTGAPLAAGLDFYDRLVDELLAAGIEPWPTLFHWDLPQALEERGGWRERATAERFAEYAGHVHARLGDRVGAWLTVNEPWCAAFLGYAAGIHAPGAREPAAAVRAAHHVLLAHGLGLAALRAGGAQRAGVALNLAPVAPASSAPADVDAARRIDGLMNRLFLEPVLHGRLPADVVEDLAPVCDQAHVRDGDLALIGAPIDVLGINYYYVYEVAGDPAQGGTGGGEPAGPEWVGAEGVRFLPQPEPRTAIGWGVVPDGLRATLLRVAEEAPGLPLAITENGAAYPRGDDDAERAAFLASHLRAAAQAIREGAPLVAFMVWSLLDNFEWAEGYGMRFGIVDVDFETLVRTPRRSARLLAQVIAANAG